MLKNKIILVVGGDSRLIRLAELFQKNNKVYCVGLEQSGADNLLHTTIENLILTDKSLDYIVLPLPSSLDNITINAPFSKTPLSIEDILSLADCKTTILGGKLSETVRHRIGARQLSYIDYLEREELSILNAIPTAEGAIGIAMNELATTIYDTSCLIVGYGRIAKVLAPRLASLGAKVTISARKFSDLAWIKANGFIAMHNNQLGNAIKNKQLVFNTVPATVLDEKVLRNAKKDCVMIDLASKPGGIDFEVAKNLELKTIWALSLPGKVAPITAGKIIYETIENIIHERSLPLE